MRAITRIFRFLAAEHAGNCANAALFRGGIQVTEEIAVAQELALAMKGNLRLVEGKDAGHAHKRGAHSEARHVVGPCFDIQDHWVMLGHVHLTDTAQFPLPWNLWRRIRR